MRFEGVYTAVVTPFLENGDVDYDGFAAVLDDQVAQGIDGLVVIGTTGEASTLSADEKKAVVKFALNRCGKTVPVIAGAGSNNTRVACDWQKTFKEMGVAATLQVTPWYNKPSQEGLFEHFKAVVAAAPMPTMLYNVPGRCSVDLLPDTVVRLTQECADIVAIKEATGSIQRAEEILAKVERDDFTVLSGDDGNILAMLSIGGHGVVSVISHLCGSDLKAMFTAHMAGDKKQAVHLSHKVRPLTPALFFRPNPVPTKAALALTRLKGKMSPHVRLPLVGLNAEQQATLQSTLSAAGYAS